MRRAPWTIAAVFLASTLAATPPAAAQRPTVRSASPEAITLEPGGGSERVSVSGTDLDYFDEVRSRGRLIAGFRATLDSRGDPRRRSVEVVGEEGTGALRGATLTLRSRRLRTTLDVPVRIEVVVMAMDTEAPTAVANAPLTVSYGSPIVLDGSASQDTGGGQVVRWNWTLIQGAGGDMGDLQVNQTVEFDGPTFDLAITNTTLGPGQHTFQLQVVYDSGNLSQPAQFMVTVVETR